MKTQIVIPSSGIIELYDDIPLLLNYSVADIRTAEKRNPDYSSVITVPGTNNNNKLFAHIFDIGADRLFNPNKKTNAEVVVDKVTVMKGFLRLTKIHTLLDDEIEYELELKGRLDDLFMSIKDKLLTDISWNDLDHVWNKTNIQNSWSATVGEGYVYPWIDYGFGLPPGTMEVKCFRPATYVKEIWDRVFSYAGFQCSSAFLESDYFKHLIIPFTSERFLRSESEITNSIFRAQLTVNQPFTYTGTGSSNAVTDIIAFDDDSTPPDSDTGNNYDATGGGTSSFTAPVDGIYSFNAQATLHVEIDVTAAIQAYLRLVKNGTDVLTYSDGINFTYDPVLFPSGSDEVQTVLWTGFLYAGETISVEIYTIISSIPGSQNNSVLQGAFFYNTLIPEFVAGSTIPYSAAIPQNVKMEDFLLAIIKMFNLYFEYDKDVSNKIHIEPRNDYYSSAIQDWSRKLDTSQPLLIEPMGALETKRYILKYRQDEDWLNEKYQSTYHEVNGESYGIKIKTVDDDFLLRDTILEVMFSPTPLFSDTTSDRIFPKIVKTDWNTQVPGIVNGNLKILYYGGELDCKQWTFYTTATTSGTIHTSYPYCGHIDHPSSPGNDLCFGVPKEIYYTPSWAATYTDNNIYNHFWKQFIDEINDKNSSIVTGWFHLTPADICMLDFRHWYRFGFQNYRLNKIYDYDAVYDKLTKCEFIKIRTSQPFVTSSLLLTGARDAAFSGGEAGPSVFSAHSKGGLHSASFFGASYQHNDLISSIPDIDFFLFSDNGSGTLLKVNDGYTFDSATGTITAPDDNYRILIF